MSLGKCVLVFTAISSLMGGPALASGWATPTTITGYYVQGGGGAMFTTAANQNPDGCTTSHWLALDQSALNFKELYATIMTAQATGQTVNLFYLGCLGGYPLINAIAVPNSW